MKKSELRKLYKQKRKQLSSKELDEASLAIANRVLELNIWDKEFYHIFLPIENLNELNTEYILNILNGKDKNIVLPKSDFNTNSLKHFLLMDNTRIRTNAYGIPEPEDGILIEPNKLDVIFVPLLAYDKEGNRIGYGKGFYDRFLSECRPDAVKIGLSYFDAEKQLIDDTSDLDVRLDFCVNPYDIHVFS